jgi:hypothetical protein
MTKDSKMGIFRNLMAHMRTSTSRITLGPIARHPNAGKGFQPSRKSSIYRKPSPLPVPTAAPTTQTPVQPSSWEIPGVSHHNGGRIR